MRRRWNPATVVSLMLPYQELSGPLLLMASNHLRYSFLFTFFSVRERTRKMPHILYEKEPSHGVLEPTIWIKIHVAKSRHPDYVRKLQIVGAESHHIIMSYNRIIVPCCVCDVTIGSIHEHEAQCRDIGQDLESKVLINGEVGYHYCNECDNDVCADCAATETCFGTCDDGNHDMHDMKEKLFSKVVANEEELRSAHANLINQ